VAVTKALAALETEEIVLDGEAIAHCKDGLPDFFGLRSEEGGAAACLFAFDLLRLNRDDPEALAPCGAPGAAAESPQRFKVR
jgi:ATP-dependent DNA ligase